MGYGQGAERGDGGAILLSVMPACLLTTAGLVAFEYLASPAEPVVSPLLIALPTFVVMTVIGLFVALAVGLPLTRLLESRGLERPWIYPVAGAAAGAGVALLLVAGLGDSLPAAGFGALPGFLTGLIWWFYHRRHFQHRGD